jgi:hypothetical protein
MQVRISDASGYHQCSNFQAVRIQLKPVEGDRMSINKGNTSKFQAVFLSDAKESTAEAVRSTKSWMSCQKLSVIL